MRFVLMCLVACILATQLPAQTLAPGARVRVWEIITTDPPVLTTGRVSAFTHDTLGLIPDGNNPPLVVPRTAIRRLDISMGPHAGSRSGSMGIGAVIGALGGGMVAVMAGNALHRNAARAGFFGVGIGMVVGAGIGATHPGEGWHPVSLP